MNSSQADPCNYSSTLTPCVVARRDTRLWKKARALFSDEDNPVYVSTSPHAGSIGLDITIDYGQRAPAPYRVLTAIRSIGC